MRKLLIALLLLVPLSALAVLGLPQVIDAQMNSCLLYTSRCV